MILFCLLFFHPAQSIDIYLPLSLFLSLPHQMKRNYVYISFFFIFIFIFFNLISTLVYFSPSAAYFSSIKSAAYPRRIQISLQLLTIPECTSHCKDKILGETRKKGHCCCRRRSWRILLPKSKGKNGVVVPSSMKDYFQTNLRISEKSFASRTYHLFILYALFMNCCIETSLVHVFSLQIFIYYHYVLLILLLLSSTSSSLLLLLLLLLLYLQSLISIIQD